jgi:hypothetical protein
MVNAYIIFADGEYFNTPANAYFNFFNHLLLEIGTPTIYPINDKTLHAPILEWKKDKCRLCLRHAEAWTSYTSLQIIFETSPNHGLQRIA